MSPFLFWVQVKTDPYNNNIFTILQFFHPSYQANIVKNANIIYSPIFLRVEEGLKILEIPRVSTLEVQFFIDLVIKETSETLE